LAAAALTPTRRTLDFAFFSVGCFAAHRSQASCFFPWAQ
jgi:hypothetical protein